MGEQQQGSGGDEEQNVRLFSLFECLLLCEYRVNKAHLGGFGDAKAET